MKHIIYVFVLLYSTLIFSQQRKEDSLSTKTTTLDSLLIITERTLKESSITIEGLNSNDLKNHASFSYYEGLENIKGVEMNTTSLTFKSINTRGFATFSNERFIQLVDGGDISSPAFNFVIGDFLALDDLDVDKVEILPGPSSALYGINAYNGLLNVKSKNPFEHTGVSVYAKTGITSSDVGGDNGYANVGIRLAHAFNPKFAAKVSFSFLEGKDWVARDYNDINQPNATRDTPNFDGLNIYGDEQSETLDFDALGGTPTGTLGTATVSRTGYLEEDLANSQIQNVRTNIALHFRPFEDDFEIILNSKIGRGHTMYSGANRFAMRDVILQQYKVQIKNDNFSVKSYFTKESMGNSYDTRYAGININRSWKSDEQWFSEYGTAYVNAINAAPNDVDGAHRIARSIADTGRLIPGSSDFENVFTKVIQDSDLSTGAKFISKSSLFHADFNYDFSHLTDVVSIQSGGSFRRYTLDSGGTFFTDSQSPIHYNEYGAFLQLQKKILNKLEVTTSLRLYKSQNYDANLSPRVAFSYAVDHKKDHYIRASFQQAFRNPTGKDQYGGIDVGNAVVLGAVSDNLDRFLSRTLSLSETAQQLGFGETVQLNGRNAYENAYTLSSLESFGFSAANGAPDPSLLEVATTDFITPEGITTFEIGYRGKWFQKLMVDTYAYYSDYKDFITQTIVIAPHYGNADLSDVNSLLGVPNALIAIGNNDFTPFALFENTSTPVSSYGGAIGLSTALNNLFDIDVNYTYAKLDVDDDDSDFQTRFNTPEHKLKATLAGNNIINNLGFAINWRWNDAYLWESDFAVGTIPARSVVDVQVNWDIPKWYSKIKLGGTNLTQNGYVTAPGASTIGSQYYISWVLNR